MLQAVKLTLDGSTCACISVLLIVVLLYSNGSSSSGSNSQQAVWLRHHQRESRDPCPPKDEQRRVCEQADALRGQADGTDQAQMQSYEDRSKYRAIVGTKYARELILK